MLNSQWLFFHWPRLSRSKDALMRSWTNCLWSRLYQKERARKAQSRPQGTSKSITRRPQASQSPREERACLHLSDKVHQKTIQRRVQKEMIVNKRADFWLKAPQTISRYPLTINISRHRMRSTVQAAVAKEGKVTDRTSISSQRALAGNRRKSSFKMEQG